MLFIIIFGLLGVLGVLLYISIGLLDNVETGSRVLDRSCKRCARETEQYLFENMLMPVLNTVGLGIVIGIGLLIMWVVC